MIGFFFQPVSHKLPQSEMAIPDSGATILNRGRYERLLGGEPAPFVLGETRRNVST